jgi:hypothetical protein
METTKIVKIMEDLLRRAAEAQVVEIQVAVAPVEEIQVAVAPVEEIQVAVAPVEVAPRRQEAEVRPQNHVSTTKTKTETGATLHQRKDGALDCFEGCDSYHFILILFACLLSFSSV